MNRLLNTFIQVINSTFSVYITKFKAKFLQTQKLTKKISAEIKKFIHNSMEFILCKPSSIKDYFHIKDIYISKRFVLKIVICIIVVFMFVIKIAYPYLNGRLWSANLVVNTNEYHEFTGNCKVYTKDNKLLYKGDMENGKASGSGKLYDENGSLVYEGEFSDNKYNGSGELYENGKLLYKGEFTDNKYNGKGQLFFYNGNIKFSGTFLEGFYLDGIEYYESGRKKYSGAYENGQYTGEAVLYANNIDNNIKYSGEFLNGEYNGEGYLYRLGDLLYNGSFVDGKYDGNGKLYNGLSIVYEGNFRDNKKNGEGRLYTDNGKYLLYNGEFKDDLYDGTGTVYDENTGRVLYSGTFLQGVYQGEGTLYGENGQKLYVGNFYQGNIDYMNYSNADEEQIKEAFGNYDNLVYLDSTYLLVYSKLKVAFEFGYVEMEETPIVERIRFWGKGSINSVTMDMTLSDFREMFKDNEIYTEYEFIASEAEVAVTEYMESDIQLGETLYCIKYNFDNYYIRVYSKDKNGTICYIETGGI